MYESILTKKDINLFNFLIFFCYLTTDGSFTQDFILKNRLNYFTVDAKPFDVYEHPLQASIIYNLKLVAKISATKTSVAKMIEA